MAKGPDAFRTISEVAEWLDVPTHVLRFWESRFTQVKPVKRAGGRRYYRPADMQLLGGIKRLLHDEGLTIRGVQKLLREEGVRHVAALSPSIDGEAIEPPSAKIITLDTVRSNGSEGASTDHWEEGEAIETLVATAGEDDAPEDFDPAGADEPAASHFPEAMALPPLVIAPLAAIGRAGRARRARELSSALIEAEILARAWDARI
ncbi:MerR family transcriptional regulator [Palleronia marisminoris]|nr:MerR family transcriptional regulator [Palleronia marisminoris]